MLALIRQPIPQPHDQGKIRVFDVGCGQGVGKGALMGMVQILGFSGNGTDRPRASTVEVLSVVGPIAGSGTLEAVQAQHVQPVPVGLASQQLSGSFSLALRAMAPLQRPVIEAELQSALRTSAPNWRRRKK